MIIKQRQFGIKHPVQISEVTFGTMRFDQNRIPKKEAIKLLYEMFDAGIDTHHSSHEYESYGFYCDCLKEFKKQQLPIKHIVKLSSPSFQESVFDAEQFVECINQELASLHTETLTNVQWLLRGPTPFTDTQRIKIYNENKDTLEKTFQSLIREGKVQSFSMFPYSEAFTEEVLPSNIIEGLTAYLNLFETEYGQVVQNKTSGFIAIRPLAAAKLTYKYITENHLESVFSDFLRHVEVDADDIASLALCFPLSSSGVSSMILSINNKVQLDRLINSLNKRNDFPDFTVVLEAAKLLPDFGNI